MRNADLEYSATAPDRAIFGLRIQKGTGTSPLVIRDQHGQVLGGLSCPGCAPVQTVTSAYKINVDFKNGFWSVCPITSSGVISNAIMNIGVFDGMQVTLINVGTNNITFDVKTTSLVAVPGSPSLAPGSSRTLTWNHATNLWYG